MDTFDAIESRRSVKKFDPDHALTEDEIGRLMEATILSPTSFNIQNWRFVLVTDPAVKEKFKEYGWNQAQFTDCSVIVLICGDRGAYGQDTERYWVNAGEETATMLAGMIRGAYDGKTELQRDEDVATCHVLGHAADRARIEIDLL